MVKKQLLIQPKTENYCVSKPGSPYGRGSNLNRGSTSPTATRSTIANNYPSTPSDTCITDKYQVDPLVSNNVFMSPLITESSLPTPKILKSCIRCRKHKTKCDASDKSPNPCSSCAKKGIECQIDYVLPPQRFDNLKNLIGQVDGIKRNYACLEDYYTKISNKLDIKIESFEEWKAKKQLESPTSDEKKEDSEDTKNTYNLIKLSDGSFISMNMIDDNKLLINNKIIEINDFQSKLNKLRSRLSYLYQTTKDDSLHIVHTPSMTEDESNNSSTDDNSSIASPISVLNNMNNNIGIAQAENAPLHNEKSYCHFTSGTILPQNVEADEKMRFTPQKINRIGNTMSHDIEFVHRYSDCDLFDKYKSLFDLKLSVPELFRANKFLLILLVGFFYPDSSTSINTLNHNLFLSDYLNSYYQIINNQNKASNSSTYSSFLINSIPGYHLIFNKDQLKDLIDCEIFNSEHYLKKLIQILFINVLIYGLDEHFKILKDFIEFVEKNINSNRKKINFDKNEDLKFINHYIQLFNSLDKDESLQIKDPQTIMGNFKTLLKLDAEFTTLTSQPEKQSLFISNPKPSTSSTLYLMKSYFKTFVTQWLNCFQLYQDCELGFFIDDFLIEVFVINCLIFINEGYQEFNTILLEFLENYKVHNESLIELIEFFKTKDSTITIQNFQYSCSQFEQIVVNLIMNKKNIIDLQINDIQVILENVDWKTESTDDVLKKIGVI